MRYQLTIQEWHNAILAGCHHLVNQKTLLNQINIFPVADGDTGDNMASTASAIMHFSLAKASMAETLQSIADASVIGARGNSGIIFSQFFNALAEPALHGNDIGLNDFASLLSHAATEVRASISSPVEGTMLTIITALATIVTKHSRDNDFFEPVLEALIPALEQAVDQTKITLSALTKANVVDAGALGFYYFVQGFAGCLINPVSLETTTLPVMTVPNHDEVCFDTPPQYRYCTEAVLRATAIDKSELISVLQSHGDSAVITGNDHICRFHVHASKPQMVFSDLLNKGTLQYPKVDDMLRQFEVAHQKKSSIALVTDSSADISQALQDSYQIHQIPLNLYLNDHHLLDRYGVHSDSFYQQLSQLDTYPSTSCPSPAVISDKLRYLAGHYDEVLVISMAKAMSGTYSAIAIEAQKYPNITVIDSRNTSGAQGLLLHYAGELIDAGKSFSEITTLVNEAIASTFIFVVVDQFDSMIRSGRVNKFKGYMAQFSGIKPIVSIHSEGHGYVYGKSFSVSRAMTKIIKDVQDKCDSGMVLEDYCIVHAGNLTAATDFAALTTEAFGKSPAWIETVSLAIGLHAGQGSVALALRMRHSQ